MNQDQIMGILRATVPAALAYIAGKGWIPAGATSDVAAAVISLGAAAWSVFAHSDSAKIAATAALPTIAKITTVVNPPPGSAAAEAAADSTQTKVVKG
jgi:hypothetical protein